jgi:hypothetical protein
MDFLKWYKHKIMSNDLEPSEHIWEGIQEHLSIERSWNAIEKNLAKKTVHRRIKYTSIAASFLILISIGSYWYTQTTNKQIEIQPITQELNQIEKSNIEVESKIENVDVEYSELNKIKNVNINQHRSYFSENINLSKNDLSKKANIIDRNEITENELLKLQNKLISFDDSTHYNLILANSYNQNKFYQTSQNNEGNLFNKLYIGSTGQLANTWFLNEKTYNGLESSSLTKSNASFGSNFGVYIGTNLSKRIDIQLDINILAINNQDYNEYLNGEYIENKLSMKYSQAALSARLYFISKKFVQGEHGVNLGFYTGYLHNAYQIINGETINLTSDYTNFDYGVFIGYEYVVPLTKNLGFGTGFKAYYGLQNIYSGNNYIPSYLNKTNNAALNISFSLKYNLK